MYRIAIQFPESTNPGKGLTPLPGMDFQSSGGLAPSSPGIACRPGFPLCGGIFEIKKPFLGGKEVRTPGSLGKVYPAIYFAVGTLSPVMSMDIIEVRQDLRKKNVFSKKCGPLRL
jgi:hypothetical protein